MTMKGEVSPKPSVAVEQRIERLARLKLVLDNGTYRIPADAIAENLINRLKERPSNT
jgi:anti-sigma28 factor (negative regulator of flagellin synthesis)